MTDLLLNLHILGGSLSLIAAAGALVTEKGQTRHRLLGKLYSAGMTMVFLTALPLAVVRPNAFLFLIAIFSFYLVFSGYRFAVNRRGPAASIDWLATALLGLAGIGMAVMSVLLLKAGDDQWVTMGVFAAIAIAFSVVDGRRLTSAWPTGKERIAKHLTNMLGGTIATVTATLVVNVQTDPVWIAWVAPTALMTPIIIYWNRRTLRQ
ncbi:MAG: hypothetical protein K0U93_29595 [Gammaproteobacteria bacterium]|nr:hypothetical protein [Gammaproteobacteria bacterium]